MAEAATATATAAAQPDMQNKTDENEEKGM